MTSAYARTSAGHQQFDEFIVRGREEQGGQVAPRNPLHLLAEHRLRHSDEIAPIEEQRDRTIRIGVGGFEHQLVNDDIGVKLLDDFASKCRVVRFAGVDLASGEFPMASEVHALLSPREEKTIVVLDHGGDDDERECCNEYRPLLIQRHSHALRKL